MRVFLTGVSGHLGLLLAGHLSRLPGIDGITGVDVAEPRAPLPGKVAFTRLDIRSRGVADAMRGHDVVVHTAFIVRWMARMPEGERRDVNLNGLKNLLDAAVANKVRRFVHASSVAAYDEDGIRGRDLVAEDMPIGTGRSRFYYSNDKALAERLLNDRLAGSGMTATILRPTYVIGPSNPGTVDYLRRTRDSRFGAVHYRGHNPRLQLVHEDDAAAAFALAVGRDLPGAYNVAPDGSLRWSQALEVLGRMSAPTVPLSAVRLWANLAWRFFKSPMHPVWVDVGLADATFDNAKLKAAGWMPRYDTAAAIRATLPAGA
jgi:nucleoside-diphosphate-sugar epimerase